MLRAPTLREGIEDGEVRRWVVCEGSGGTYELPIGDEHTVDGTGDVLGMLDATGGNRTTNRNPIEPLNSPDKPHAAHNDTKHCPGLPRSQIAIVIAALDQDIDVDDAPPLPEPAPCVPDEPPPPPPLNTDSHADAIIAHQLSSARTPPDAPLHFAEKKHLDWARKTLGFTNSFLSDSKEERPLVQRHPSEKIVGMQIAGHKAHSTQRRRSDRGARPGAGLISSI
ncbi:hypothetical protein FB451DRAFT_1388146 [Mycena latifolia]|nr:hypothetical protein FB451DRAFT_1388146 [Mycena latifolia]